ncbi:MAG: recombinase family protein, partial [Myxococcales bacterium]|nr:recombinase family protein [Myxococcales bacterium]
MPKAKPCTLGALWRCDAALAATRRRPTLQCTTRGTHACWTDFGLRRVDLLNVYIRVSTTDQRYLGQFREIRRAVEAQGWTIARVFREKRSAAHGSHRPAWQKLRAEAAMRRFGAVAVWALDRMGRSCVELLSAVQAFSKRGVRLLTVQQGTFEKGSAAKLMLSILAAVAEMERDLISERTRMGLHAARDSGKRLGRPATEIPAADLQAIADGHYTVAAGARRHQVSRRTVERRIQALRA